MRCCIMSGLPLFHVLTDVPSRLNQQAKGRTEAFSTFRDILAREMASGIPDIKDEVQQVVAATNGKLA